MIELTEEILRSMPAPNQLVQDWKTYIRFLQSYCKQRGIVRPIVVEVGTQHGAQKAHYQKFLDAEHIGIDMVQRSAKYSQPDIIGNSHDPRTVKALAERLVGRKINFLFVDGGHSYNDVACDWYAYSPLVSDVIAFHDIRHEKGVGQFWHELVNSRSESGDKFIKIGAWGNGWCELGIGLIILGRTHG